MIETEPPLRLPERLEILPFSQPPQGSLRVPGSKSLTNRALILAALSNGGSFTVSAGQPQPTIPGSILTGVLRSEDTEIMVDCLKRLGFSLECDWSESRIIVNTTGGKIPAREANLFVGNSGTTMRFLTALVALGQGRYRLDGISRMRERPIKDLLLALGALGVHAVSENNTGCPPVLVESRGLPGGKISLRGDISSQFLSGLLMAAPLAQGDIAISVEGPLVSWPYVAMTMKMMRQFHVRVYQEPNRRFQIPGNQHYLAQEYDIEPDASAASYFAGMAAITGGEIHLQGLHFDSLQGDVRFLRVLQQMGCEVYPCDGGLKIVGFDLHGIDVDMNDISDTVMTLAVVACFAEGPTTIRHVAHIRHKETDRLGALATELRKVGAEIKEFEDGLTIHPRPLHGAVLETYNDHRMAMSLALLGLKVPGIVLQKPGCVVKTYPHFFRDLEQLRC